MQKFLTFLKNYKKTLIVAFISLICVVLITVAAFFIRTKAEINNVNSAQLPLVAEKAQDLFEYFDNVSELRLYSAENEFRKLYSLINLEPEDVHNKVLLDKYLPNLKKMDNFIILDRDLNIVNACGSVYEVNYKDSHYTKLFTANEGEVAFVNVKDDVSKVILSAKCNNYFILTQTTEEKIAERFIPDSTVWEAALKLAGIHVQTKLAVLDNITGDVIYSNYTGIENISIPYNETNRDNYLSDYNLYIQYYDAKDMGVVLCAISEPIQILKSIDRIMIASVFMYITILFILISFIICLRQDELDPEQEFKFLNKYFLHTQVRKFKTIAIIVGLISFFIFVLLTNLNNGMDNVSFLTKETKETAESVEHFIQTEANIRNYRDDLFFSHLRISNDFLNEHNDYLTKKGMTKLSDAMDIQYLTVFDSDGNTICTSSPLDNLNILSDPESEVYKLKDVLIGKEGMMVEPSINTSGASEVIHAIPRRNSDEKADGMIAFTSKGGYSNSVQQHIDHNDILIPSIAEDINGSLLYTIDGNGAVINISTDTSEDTIRDILNIDTDPIPEGIYSSIKKDHVNYLASIKWIDSLDSLICIIMPAEWLNNKTVSRSFILIIIYALMVLWIGFDSLGSKYHFEKRERKIKDADEWNRTELVWEEYSISQKMGKILGKYFFITGIILIIVLIYTGNSKTENEIYSFIRSGNWMKSINPVSIIQNIIIIWIFYTGTYLVYVTLKKMEKISSDENSTFCKLLESILKYGSSIACVIIVLTNFGANTVATLASLGIIGFALTYGAQDIIKDLIAGMFILFERNFKVGDMITFNGDWYWIKAIGVRTTTLEAWGQIRVINNSNMTGIVNIENASACVDCDILLGNEYDIDKVQAIFNEELPLLKEMYPPEVATPMFKGVQSLKAQGTTVRIRTYCPPISQGWVGRSLRREIKRILDNNNIKLAYDAYEIHSAAVTPEELKDA